MMTMMKRKRRQAETSHPRLNLLPQPKKKTMTKIVATWEVSPPLYYHSLHLLLDPIVLKELETLTPEEEEEEVGVQESRVSEGAKYQEYTHYLILVVIT